MHSTTTTTTTQPRNGGACKEHHSPERVTNFSDLPHDVIRDHILPLLDGCTLASVGSTTPELHTLTSDQDLWSHLCHSTWPSTTTPRLRHVISTLPGGPRTFFSHSYPPPPSTLSSSPSLSTECLISAVDIFYRGNCIFSKVQETETTTGWFLCSPFRIDLLAPKDSVPTPIRRPSHEDMCRGLYTDLQLSWILISKGSINEYIPNTTRIVNLSSLKPVSVEKHWLSGEVHVRYATVVDEVMFGVELTCVGCGPGGLVLHVIEACLKMEDLEGAHLHGRDSLVILQRVFEGKRVNSSKGMKGRYLEYLERRKEWRENKVKREGRLDIMCVVFGLLFFASLFCWSFLLAVVLKLMSLPMFRADQLRTRIRFVPS